MEVSEVEKKILELVYTKDRPAFDGVKNEWWKEDGTPRTRRLILVYNPRSSKAARVKEEVLVKLQTIPGVMKGKYEVKPTNVDDNAEQLSKILEDGDIVVTAGGDGTATIGLNGVVLSGKAVRFMAVPYGNFNDMPRTLKEASGKELYPLEAIIDGKHFRYAACYFTIGMFAESTEVFDEKSTRKNLQKGNKSTFFSLMKLAKWYFRNKKKQFIPPFKYSSQIKTYDKNGIFQVHVDLLTEDDTKNVSDYLAVNGMTVAKMMKGNKNLYTNNSDFLSSVGRLKKFIWLVPFMMKSIFKQIPGKISTEDVLIFPDYADIEIQAEGEYKRLEHVGKVVIRKAEKPVKIL